MDLREAQCHFLVAVLAADAHMEDDERTMLEAKMLALELDEEAKDRIRAFNGFDDAVAHMATEPEAVRQALLDELVDAALVDGKLSPLETATIKRLATALKL